MSEVIPFPTITPDMRVGSISKVIPDLPIPIKQKTKITRSEYLKTAKTTLSKNDYKMLLLAIMDKEYYNSYDELIRSAVDDYYNLGV